MPSRYLVGVAGWSYSDWEGIVYPPGKGDRLVAVARMFDTIEVNTSFYHPVAVRTMSSWIKRIESLPGFRFTVKLWQRFTHDPAPFGKEEMDAVLPALNLVQSEGRLGALLIQFPYSFKNVSGVRGRLARVLDAFAEFPCVIEIRHASFDVPGFYQHLRERRVGFCNIDQPLVSQSIHPTAVATSPVGYVRLHGRNYKEWFRQGADVASRYDYYYTPQELDEWVERVAQIGRESDSVYVVANNHYRGQAVANGLRLKSLIHGQKVEVPSSLLHTFPDLHEVQAGH